ncbi:MAG: DUF1638 domain-containing protein [Armatimonadetes bacterium]|nr:DUF1638 domain-containing protein [Armatimonadota bacterium]
MRLKVVACGVFEPELTALAEETPNEVHLHFLDAGLHATPDRLRIETQAQIDAAVGQGYDGVVAGYGLCGRGTSGILAVDTPVVIPRVHDCMTLFLGSREEYRRQFSRHPGTFYTTPGWYEKKSLGDRLSESRNETLEDIHNDVRFPELAERFGESNAEHIIFFFDSWKRNYTRAAFIDTGVGATGRYEDYARQMAESFGWEYERIPGDVSLLREILDGRWDPSRVLVLQPGQRSVLTGDDSIFAAVDVRSGQEATATATEPEQQQESVAVPVFSGSSCTSPGRIVRPKRRGEPQPSLTPGSMLGLGIDAGGTYTDCVLYDLASEQVVAKSKALTTRHALMIGIDEALDRLDIADPSRVVLVALSTTLATNSIVEGKGGIPGALIMSSAVGGTLDLDWKHTRFIAGQMSIGGQELEPPDPDQIAAAVDDLLASGVDAFAVSGYSSVKNPAHEILVRDIIRRRSDLPVVCGHELSSRLNFVSRANTAILNARLMPVIRELLDAVEASLQRREIRGTLMVVKGDGALVNRATALERPIETILSGPAASVSGAKHLTGLSDAIVLDMGGTTTDTAIIENGLVRISPEGARVGGWFTSVEAADISTVGLGGDSHIDFTADRKLLVGPRRVVPLAYLCGRYPEARRFLETIDPTTQQERSRAAALDFFILVRPDYRGPLSDREQAILKALSDGPLSRSILALRLGIQSPSLLRTARLEELGIVQRSGFTPTDVLHVTGEFSAWDAEASKLALDIFAGLYGAAPDEVIRAVKQAVVERLAGQILARELPDWPAGDPDGWPSLVHTVFRPKPGAHLSAQLAYKRPIVALGAPVEPFFPAVGSYLGAQVVIPQHAEVANAIGAIASEVVVREQAVIRPGEIVNFVLHTRAGRYEYDDLHEAIESAKSETAQLAHERALRSGTASAQVRHIVNERRALSADGDNVLIEVLVETTVSGKPELRAAT